jgi:hypothetical protein
MSSSAEVIRADYGSEEAAMQDYLAKGEAQALSLENRGPIRFAADGRIDPAILEAYGRFGFYVFEGVLGAPELADLETDFWEILGRLPSEKGSPVDAKGRPALGHGRQAECLYWSKPLGDPFGGTKFGKGRHPVKMIEPRAASNAPEEVVYLILGSLQFSDACLRTYGHPDLLAVAAAVNGDDFVPYTDAIFIKAPGLGASVAWHQDGITHWASPSWDPGSHGFNFMGQLFGCTPANGVWVVPGSHKVGKIDIAAKVAEAGTERLPDAVPMVCKPGDVVISNRQLLHGSFANTSEDWRVTVNMGMLRRSSVLGVKGGGILGKETVYDDAHIRERSRTIAYAIDARRQRFPDETPHVYPPFADAGEAYRWDDKARANLVDYNVLDMGV